jgi:ubiquinone/menaquinone biosynthesis C-methylase UbiE
MTESKVARFYASLWGDIDSIRSPEITSQFLFNLGLAGEWFKGKTCLDVGCGSGWAIASIEELGGTCYACDLEPTSLRLVRERLAGEECGDRLVSASVLDLPFRSNSFDFVHCNGVLHHTLAPRKGFDELVRVTRPGGTMFVSLYGKGGLYGAFVNFARLLSPLLPYNPHFRFESLLITSWGLPAPLSIGV